MSDSKALLAGEPYGSEKPPAIPEDIYYGQLILA